MFAKATSSDRVKNTGILLALEQASHAYCPTMTWERLTMRPMQMLDPLGKVPDHTPGQPEPIPQTTFRRNKGNLENNLYKTAKYLDPVVHWTNLSFERHYLSVWIIIWDQSYKVARVEAPQNDECLRETHTAQGIISVPTNAF
ncbi:hypothetical protein EK904_014867 [Melospiza melodia maxima]|nr:hypothetical protein EK904_014867 [Melospiza melodia maxima]